MINVFKCQNSIESTNMEGERRDYISVSQSNVKCILKLMSIKIMLLNLKHIREKFHHYIKHTQIILIKQSLYFFNAPITHSKWSCCLAVGSSIKV